MFDSQTTYLASSSIYQPPYTIQPVVSDLPMVEFISDLTKYAIQWAYQAGEIAMRHFRKVSVEYKADETLVTEADLEIERFLFSKIGEAYPTHALLGEESGHHSVNTPSTNEVDKAYMWAIDPLDGTSAFVQGLPGWGISLGLLYHGQPIFGLFYMPLLHDLTYTTHDGASCNQQILRDTVRKDWEKKGYLAVTSCAHHEFDLKSFRTRALGSVCANLVYTARGSATAALIPKARLWDLAASACILTRAGGTLCYLSGKPIDYRVLMDGSLASEAIIAGHPEIVGEICQRLRDGALSPLIENKIAITNPIMTPSWSSYAKIDKLNSHLVYV